MLNKLRAVDNNLSPGLRKIIRNIGWLSAERLLSMIISFVVGVYVIRYLGSESFGKLSYSSSFVALFAAIAKLGLDKIVVRNLVKQKNLTGEILGTAIILKFIGSLVAISLIGVTIWHSSDDIQIILMTFIIASSLMFQSFDVLDLWFKSQVLSKSIVIVRSSQFIISSLAKLSFIFFKLPLMMFAYLLLVDSIIRAVGMTAIYIKQNQCRSKWKFKKSSAINLLKDSWPLIISSVMVTLYMKIDQVMLGNMSNSQEVGNYAAAVRFSEIWYFIPTAVSTSVFPSIIKAKQKSEKEYYTKLQQLYDLMAWMSLTVAIPMSFISTHFMTVLLGQEYVKSGQILSVHIWSGLFVFLGVARSQWLMAENFTRFSLISTSLGALSNIFLNFILIPEQGGMGAAIATLISQAVASYLVCLFYPPTFNTGKMLTKALLIPWRIKQNIAYINGFKKTFLSKIF
ncbi:Membrane protein [Hyella patelloides LEGE 07179]|uniref:Membrane protein n=1 Tax=Hyella patelloides LEGE 07179 TaxID=945734 RepID=A0A563VS87_9CYAN|nr:flippase [Hyella patelloides]VEP14285.1 Membrane protein [Hyella patelloides LEGE 07179]